MSCEQRTITLYKGFLEATSTRHTSSVRLCVTFLHLLQALMDGKDDVARPLPELDVRSAIESLHIWTLNNFLSGYVSRCKCRLVAP
eukprot:281892-Amphidinium_carterae.2